MHKKVLFLIWIFFLSSCGYKPSSHYIQYMFEDKIYVKVTVDPKEPENAPFVKDEMNRLVYARFKGSVVPQSETKNYIKVNYKGSTFIPLAHRDAYVTRYRANIYVDFTMMTKDGEVSKKVHARHEDDIVASSFTSSVLRTQAIRKGLAKALDEFLAYASVKGIDILQHSKKKVAKVSKIH